MAGPDACWKKAPPRPAPTLARPQTVAVARRGTTSAGKASVFAVYAAQPKPAVASTTSAERGPLITSGPDSRAAAIVSAKIDTASLRALGTGTPRRITN